MAALKGKLASAQGEADLTMAGGTDAKALPKALASVKSYVAERV